MAGNVLIDIMRKAGQMPASQTTDMLFGEVTSISPLKIKVDNRFEISEGFLVLTSLVSNFNVDMEVDGNVKNYSINLGLRRGEKVILLRVQSGQKFIIIDRVR